MIWYVVCSQWQNDKIKIKGAQLLSKELILDQLIHCRSWSNISSLDNSSITQHTHECHIISS